MNKPCVVCELETLKNGDEKATFHFMNLNSNATIIFDVKNKMKLFRKLCDYMKTGEVFDFNSLSLDDDTVSTKNEVKK